MFCGESGLPTFVKHALLFENLKDAANILEATDELQPGSGYTSLSNFQPRMMHCNRCDWFTQYRLSAHIP